MTIDMSEHAGDDPADWPTVAVVLPIRNEAAHLAAAIDSIRAQAYPGALSIVMAVGPSTDDTAAVAAELAAASAGSAVPVIVVDNPTGGTAAGLNRAIAASSGAVVVRVDGHSVLSPGYITRAVETLARTGAANVGGIQRAVGTTTFQQAVAAAMTSRFGTGDAVFHYGGEEGPADTVYLGVFDRAALDAVGGFDERLVRNQDYELNIRLRAAGHVVWFDPQLIVDYRPRATLAALARQYFEYGTWKRVVVRAHPGSLRWRQAVPPLTTAAVAGGVVIGLAWRRALLLPLAYLAAVGLAAVSVGRRPLERLRLTAIFPAMHLSWGAGFLVGGRRDGARRLRPGR